MNKTVILLLSVLILVVAVTGMGVLSAARVQAHPTSEQDAAVKRAVEIARERGLQTQPAALVAKKATLGEWFAIVGFEPGSEAASVGLDPSTPIWIIAMRGPVEWSGPGKQTGGAGDQFDNITIALGTGRLDYVGSHAAGPGQPLPLGLTRQ